MSVDVTARQLVVDMAREMAPLHWMVS